MCPLLVGILHLGGSRFSPGWERCSCLVAAPLHAVIPVLAHLLAIPRALLIVTLSRAVAVVVCVLLHAAGVAGGGGLSGRSKCDHGGDDNGGESNGLHGLVVGLLAGVGWCWERRGWKEDPESFLYRSERNKVRVLLLSCAIWCHLMPLKSELTDRWMWTATALVLEKTWSAACSMGNFLVVEDWKISNKFLYA